MFFEMGAILQKKPVLQQENASRPNVFWIESTRNIFSIQRFWKNHEFFMGAMLMKIVILLKENESHIIKKINKCEKNVNT